MNKGKEKKKLTTKTAELARDINIVTGVGKVAVGVLFPPSAIIMYPWAALDAATAVGAHAVAKHLDKKKK